MKIILSPSKTMDLKKKTTNNLSKPQFWNESEHLRSILKSDSLDEIQTRFKTSDRLSKEVFSFFQEDFPSKAAIATYKGQVFSNLDYESFNAEEKAYAQEHLRILSALYGVLKPLDAIKPYRLDFIVPFPFNLYDFWYEKINEIAGKDEMIINLASKEFSQLIDERNLFHIHFVNQDGKSPSMMVKKARGQFARKVIEKQCTKLQEIRDLRIDGFELVEETENSMTFQVK